MAKEKQSVIRSLFSKEGFSNTVLDGLSVKEKTKKSQTRVKTNDPTKTANETSVVRQLWRNTFKKDNVKPEPITGGPRTIFGLHSLFRTALQRAINDRTGYGHWINLGKITSDLINREDKNFVKVNDAAVNTNFEIIRKQIGIISNAYLKYDEKIGNQDKILTAKLLKASDITIAANERMAIALDNRLNRVTQTISTYTSKLDSHERQIDRLVGDISFLKLALLNQRKDVADNDDEEKSFEIEGGTENESGGGLGGAGRRRSRFSKTGAAAAAGAIGAGKVMKKYASPYSKWASKLGGARGLAMRGGGMALRGLLGPVGWALLAAEIAYLGYDYMTSDAGAEEKQDPSEGKSESEAIEFITNESILLKANKDIEINAVRKLTLQADRIDLVSGQIFMNGVDVTPGKKPNENKTDTPDKATSAAPSSSSSTPPTVTSPVDPNIATERKAIDNARKVYEGSKQGGSQDATPEATPPTVAPPAGGTTPPDATPQPQSSVAPSTFEAEGMTYTTPENVKVAGKQSTFDFVHPNAGWGAPKKGGTSAKDAATAVTDKVELSTNKRGQIDKAKIRAYLTEKFRNSKLNGVVPPDGKRYGIDGSPESWAHFATELVGKESSYNPKTHGDVGLFGGSGSRGLLQLSPKDALNHKLQDKPFSIKDLEDPYKNLDAGISIMENQMSKHGTIRQGLGAYWGPVKRGWVPTPPQIGEVAPQPGAGREAHMHDHTHGEGSVLTRAGKARGAGDLTTITTKNGAKLTVATRYATRFRAFVDDLEANGYRIKGNTSGGYNYRNIRGSSRLSNHATGSAIDINWDLNPLGRGPRKKGALDPELARKLAKKHGLTWGGDWKSPYDPMHFEISKDTRNVYEPLNQQAPQGKNPAIPKPAGAAAPGPKKIQAPPPMPSMKRGAEGIPGMPGTPSGGSKPVMMAAAEPKGAAGVKGLEGGPSGPAAQRVDKAPDTPNLEPKAKAEGSSGSGEKEQQVAEAGPRAGAGGDDGSSPNHDVDYPTNDAGDSAPAQPGDNGSGDYKHCLI